MNDTMESYKDEYQKRIETLSKQYSYNEASELKVSKRTARWVELYKQTQTLWGDISDLIECDGYDKDIDAVIEKELVPTIGVLQDFLMKRIEQSVWENLGSRSNAEMI